MSRLRSTVPWVITCLAIGIAGWALMRLVNPAQARHGATAGQGERPSTLGGQTGAEPVAGAAPNAATVSPRGWQFARTLPDIYGHSEPVYRLRASEGPGELDVFCNGKQALAEVNGLSVLAGDPVLGTEDEEIEYELVRFGSGPVREVTCTLTSDKQGLSRCGDPRGVDADPGAFHQYRDDWVAHSLFHRASPMRIQWKSWLAGWQVSTFSTAGLTAAMRGRAGCR